MVRWVAAPKLRKTCRINCAQKSPFRWVANPTLQSSKKVIVSRFIRQTHTLWMRLICRFDRLEDDRWAVRSSWSGPI